MRFLMCRLLCWGSRIGLDWTGKGEEKGGGPGKIVLWGGGW